VKEEEPPFKINKVEIKGNEMHVDLTLKAPIYSIPVTISIEKNKKNKILRILTDLLMFINKKIKKIKK
jgi:hypothetical protein